MNDEEKQIEEMANIIRCRAEQLPRCPHITCSICKATELYNTGYRKASDVINEFAYGLKDFLHDAPVVYQAWFRKKIDSFADRFKKKYESKENKK